MDSDQVAFIGTGAMGSALARGIVASGACDPAHLKLYDVDSGKAASLASEIGATSSSSAADAIKGASVVFVAVKPKDVVSLLAEISATISSNTIVAVIAAGVSTTAIQNALSNDVAVARIMPNTPALVGEGAAGVCFTKQSSPSQRDAVLRLLRATGLAVEVDESLMNAVTGLSGSGPAFVYTFIEALADAGVSSGLSRSDALKLAAQTVLGAARMVIDSGSHPAQLRDQVTSPGGTTIAGCAELERSGFRAAVINAVQAATKRAGELSQ